MNHPPCTRFDNQLPGCIPQKVIMLPPQPLIIVRRIR